MLDFANPTSYNLQMTTLDHSCASLLLDDLVRHKDDRFRFLYKRPSGRGHLQSASWRLVSATLFSCGGGRVDGVCVECIYSGQNVPPNKRTSLHLQLIGGGWLDPRDSDWPPMMIVLDRSSLGASAGDSQRDQLDKNLRGIFA